MKFTNLMKMCMKDNRLNYKNQQLNKENSKLKNKKD